jgi:8-oxo-dGTP pyrophosphatase MutT (NUDIX family)
VAEVEEPIEPLNPGSPVEPRPAASVILLRRGGGHGDRGLEVLLAKRSPSARFMPSAWVFPGGAVDAEAAAAGEPSDDAYQRTALRELEEEVAIVLEPDGLVAFSRWITPVEVAIRFDTRFYLALAPPHCAPEPDGEEIVEASWFAPSDALERRASGEMLLVFPTVKHLEALAGFGSAEEALAAARSKRTEPILPRVVVSEGDARIVLPGERGYESA